MKKIIIGGSVIGVLVLVVAGAVVYSYIGNSPKAVSANTGGNVICTEDVRQCPDGSYVARTGPKCEFAVCPVLQSKLTEAQAKVIAEKSCIKSGESLATGVYNSSTKTWWFDATLKTPKQGCSPACVVNEDTNKAEINWRCTGLVMPNK